MTPEEKQFLDKLTKVSDATTYVWATMIETLGGAHSAVNELSKGLWCITNAQDILNTGLPVTDCIEIDTIWHASPQSPLQDTLCGIRYEKYAVSLSRVPTCPQCRQLLEETLSKEQG